MTNDTSFIHLDSRVLDQTQLLTKYVDTDNGWSHHVTENLKLQDET